MADEEPGAAKCLLFLICIIIGRSWGFGLGKDRDTARA